MDRIIVILLLTKLVVWPATAAAQQDVELQVAVTDGVWIDDTRNREVPFRLYRPAQLEGPYPVIIISHGLGGSIAGNAQLGHRLAANEYIAIAVQHHGSDATLIENLQNPQQIRRNLQRSLANPENLTNRLADIPFVLTQLNTLEQQYPELAQRLDLEKIGMAGHSYGAISTMVAAGQRMGAQYLSFKAPQIGAGVVLSPSPPNSNIDLQRAYRDIDIPLFHITGTNDQQPLSNREFQPSNRLDPYRNLSTSDQYLLILEGAEHATFSGSRIGRRSEANKDRSHLEDILNGSIAFFNAYIKQDHAAKQWLRNDFPPSLDAGDLFEFK